MAGREARKATRAGSRAYTELRSFDDDSVLTVAHAAALSDGRRVADVASRSAIMFDDSLTLRSQQMADGVLSGDGLREHARNLLREFYAERDEPLEPKRWDELEAELARTGTYTLTADELSFGCQTAWRNHSRCIGRAVWRSLLVRDNRHVSEPADVFEHILKQLSAGFNGGVLQPVITVFSQQAPVILNKQIIGYAGYRQGTQVIGDPANVDFTSICINLGWYSKGTHFDVLPIVLFDVQSEKLFLFELPEEYHFQIDIEHPFIEDFKRIGLKWYAIPVVSFMAVEMGGLVYKTIPFNGWYMSTEIATRDLGDQQRYGSWVLPAVAKRMGLNVMTDRLWKDRVVTELNTAVLYSFEKKGVSIMDHYTLSERFMQWHKSEVQTRGHCAADWVWIVPPTSGSLCAVFHQEMLNYTASPNYFYPDAAIATRAFRASRAGTGRRPADGGAAPNLKRVALMVLATAIMKGAAVSERNHVGLIYASETGTAKEMAYEALEFINQIRGIKAVIYDFNGIAQVPLHKLQKLIFIVATSGAGVAPSSCRKAFDWLRETIRSGRDGHLRDMPYAMLALGSTAYMRTYCSFGHKLAELLEEAGAKAMLAIHEADAVKNQSIAFNEWLHGVRLHLAASLGMQLTETAGDLAPLSVADVTLNVQPRGLLLPAPQPERGRFIVAARRTVTTDASATTSAVVLRPEDRSVLADGTALCQPGDHLIVRPENSAEAAHRVARMLGIDDFHKSFTLVGAESGDSVSKWWRFPMPMTFAGLFGETLDLSAPPPQELIHELLDIADCSSPTTEQRLSIVASRPNDYLAWIRNEKPNLATLLEALRITKDNRERLLISILTKQPVVHERYYSIASCARDTVELCFDRVDIGGPQERVGLGSSFLGRVAVGRSVVARITRGIFTLPPDNAPVVMFAGGSGIAPFRSFWQHFERKPRTQRPSTFALFYGFRLAARAPYLQEARRLAKRGVVTQLLEAPSRETPRRYVSAVLRRDGEAEALVRGAVAAGGYVYICGSVRFWAGVRDALDDALAGVTTLAQLSDDGRLFEEPFTSTNDYGDSDHSTEPQINCIDGVISIRL